MPCTVGRALNDVFASPVPRRDFPSFHAFFFFFFFFPCPPVAYSPIFPRERSLGAFLSAFFQFFMMMIDDPAPFIHQNFPRPEILQFESYLDLIAISPL